MFMIYCFLFGIGVSFLIAGCMYLLFSAEYYISAWTREKTGE